MKKKNEKKYVINSSDWTKTTVSLLEANLTQKTVVVKFFKKSDLSDYAICVCPLSPLLGTPESVTRILCDFYQAEILENKKLYIVFSDIEDGPALDENGQLVVSKLSISPIALKDNEVVGILKKDTEDTWKLLDWVAPIADEIIPLDILKKASIAAKNEDTDGEEDVKFMRKKGNSSFSFRNNAKVDFFYTIKPKLWLYTFIILISFIELSSLIPFSETLWMTVFEVIVLVVRNICIGTAVYNFISSDKKISKTIAVQLLLAVSALILSLVLFSYDAVTAVLLILFVVIIFSLLIPKQKVKQYL